MFGVPFLSAPSAHKKEVLGDLFEYFVKFKYIANSVTTFESRENLLKALKLDSNFNEFWNKIRETCPQEKQYFESLLNVEEKFDCSKLQTEYEKFLQKLEFEKLFTDERSALEAEYYKVRRARFQLWLKDWEYKFGHVMPTSENEIPKKMASHDRTTLRVEDLPYDIMSRVIPLLSAFDIFTMTMVCKKWKNLINEITKELRKADYSFGYYLFEHTSLDDDFENKSYTETLRKYVRFSGGIIRWFCKTSDNLETLIFHHCFHATELALLLQNCPNLKHLEMKTHQENKTIASQEGILMNVSLPKLEVLVCRDYENEKVESLMTNILDSTTNLQALECGIFPRTLKTHLSVCCSKKILGNLTALDLKVYSLDVLKQMELLDEFHLKYLSLGYLANTYTHPNRQINMFDLEVLKPQENLSRLLPKMKDLQVLVLSSSMRMTRKTLRLMIELKLNLQYALLWQTTSNGYFEADDDINLNRNSIPDLVTLNAFKEMLLLQDPKRDLSKITFIIPPSHIKEHESLGLDFTFLNQLETQNFFRYGQHRLKAPSIVEFLNLHS